MTVGSFKSFKKGKCSMCEHDTVLGQQMFYVEGKDGYFCSMSCLQEAYPSEHTTTTGPAETPEAARQSSISRVHEENMESARQMRSVLALLVTAVDQLRQAVVDMRLHLEGKR